MKYLATLLAFSAALFLIACSQTPPEPNTLSDAEKADGWKLLFDGETLKGWRGYMGVDLQDAWTVQNGVLSLSERGESREQVQIITTDMFDDFELRFDWKIEAGTNSGVMFHVGEGPKKPYHTGPEYQILDDKGYRSAKGEVAGPKHLTASHYAIEAPYSDEIKPVGQWNQGRIIVKGDHVEYWLNGVKTAAYVMHSPEWDAQIANAKFADWKEYATTGKGHIGLQDHNHPVHFRSLKIKEF